MTAAKKPSLRRKQLGQLKITIAHLPELIDKQIRYSTGRADYFRKMLASYKAELARRELARMEKAA